MERQWPYFVIDVPCDSPGIDCNEKRAEYVLTHGDLHLHVSVCAHVLNFPINEVAEYINENIDQHLGSIAPTLHIGTQELIAAKLATKRRIKTRRFVWEYTSQNACATCRKWKQHSFVLTDYVNESLHEFLPKDCNDVPIELIVCSEECALQQSNASCFICNKKNRNSIFGCKYMQKDYLSWNYGPQGFCEFGSDEAKLLAKELLRGRFCSEQCQSLALSQYKETEREFLKRMEELKCVRVVKTAMNKLPKLLKQSQNQEALLLLKQEFEQAATLLK